MTVSFETGSSDGRYWPAGDGEIDAADQMGSRLVLAISQLGATDLTCHTR